GNSKSYAIALLSPNFLYARNPANSLASLHLSHKSQPTNTRLHPLSWSSIGLHILQGISALKIIIALDLRIMWGY
ncbi:hypothetical protein GIB67_032569, partial [Kingdonia uniflora]